MSSSTDDDIKSENIDEVTATLALNSILFLIMWGLYEWSRTEKNVYSPRLENRENPLDDKPQSRLRPPPRLPPGPVRWIWTVAMLSGEETLEIAGMKLFGLSPYFNTSVVLESPDKASFYKDWISASGIGMDAYCLVRFTYLCLRICIFASIWGLLVLTPLYAYGKGDAEGMYVITLANVKSGSPKLWAAVVFAYLFTWHALYTLKGEHQVFAMMRERYLSRGNADFMAQTRYTSKVENIPQELRTGVALKAYFESLFPGQVHRYRKACSQDILFGWWYSRTPKAAELGAVDNTNSAVVCLDIPTLEYKVKQREILVEKLKKINSIDMASGKITEHREKRFACDCCARRTDQTETDYLSEKLRELNEKITKEQQEFLDSSQKLDALDDRLMRDEGEDAWPDVAPGLGEAGSFVQVVDDRTQLHPNPPMIPRALDRKDTLGLMRSKLDVFLWKKANPSSKWMTEVELLGQDNVQMENKHDQDESQDADGLSMTSGEAAKQTSSRSKDGKGVALGGLMEAWSAFTFVGKAAMDTTRSVARGVIYAVLGNRMSTTGFVTFRQMAACASSRQVLLAPRPNWCDCEAAPEPRDVIWENVSVPRAQANLRRNVASFLVFIGAIFWSVPVVAIQVWTSYDELKKVFPWLGDLSTDSLLYSLISGYLPAATLVLLMLILPFFFQTLSYNYECVKSHSEVQRLVLNRYFMYQLANIYVTVASGSITMALEQILKDYKAIITILGDTFPSVAVYFLNVIIVKTFAGLPFELVRGWPLIKFSWSQQCNKRAHATDKDMRTGPFKPTPLLYGWVYPILLLVLVVCFMYAVISPFIVPAGAIFFGFAYIVYKHQVLYVYEPNFESGALFWFSVYPRVVLGLALAQLTVTAYLYIKLSYVGASLTFCLPLFIYFYGTRSYQRYLGPAESVSMETAARTDSQMAAAVSATMTAGFGGDEHAGGGGSTDMFEEPVDPEMFEPRLFSQPALTSRAIEPEECSMFHQGVYFL